MGLASRFENGGNSRFSRQVGLECMSCHNGYPDFVLGSENKYAAVKNGIDCERCHGPGEKHVKDKMAGKLVDITKEIDYSIVNPSKLSINLQLDVCQRCHIQGNAVLNYGKSFFDFRPGMRLSDVMNVFMPVYAGRTDEHIMASHAERLKMSRCFIETVKEVDERKNINDLKPYKNALTCVTCHNPHVSVRVTNNDVFNSACKNCHSPEKNNSCTEKQHVIVKANNNCVKCHMVNSSTTDIPHVRVTDHFIRKPVTENEIEKVKTFIGIACINNSNPSDYAKGNAFINYFEKFNYDKSVLDSALKYFPDKTSGDITKNLHELVHISFLKKDYSRILYYESQIANAVSFLNKKSFSNSDAWTCYRIGEAFENTNNSAKALTYYQQATMLAPFVLEFQNVYGSALINTGKSSDAKKVFEFILKENPNNTMALSNLGFILLSTEGDSTGARKLYEQCIALDPDYLQVQYNMAGLYIYRHNFTEAKKILSKILVKNPADLKANQILSSISSL
jgi:tetratricopeptide (TPR) repeat protein